MPLVNKPSKLREIASGPITDTPDWPTRMRRRLTGGRCEGVDGSMWLYAKATLAPVADARDADAAYEASLPVTRALEEVAAGTPTRGKMRSMSRASYREVHLLLVNIPRVYRPPAENPNAVELTASFRHIHHYERVLVVGVRLRDKIGGSSGGFREYVDSVAQVLTERRPPVSDFDADFAAMRDALTRAGLSEPSNEDFHLLNSWWNSGYAPDVPLLIEPDHVHVFTGATALAAAARLVEAGTACADWPAMAGTFPLSFAAIEDYEQRAVPATSPDALYVPDLLRSGAAAVSIRGLLEPAKITQFELRRNRARALRDITERVEAGKMDHGEQEMLLANLTQAEDSYATESSPASLIETSTVIAFTGRDPHRGYDVSGIGNHITLNSMLNRQESAWYEMMLCSEVRANPHLHDLPITKVACSGLPSLSVVGDRDGALVGFTEGDRQPAYLSPTAASTADGLPLGLCVSQTGGGKSILMLWLAHQFGKAKSPVIVFDPKRLALTTPVPTPDGWKTMGDLVVGDRVFGSDGKPCTVTVTSRVCPTPDLYEVVFSDGQVIKADAEHQWAVFTNYDRGRRRTRARVVTTRHMLEHGLTTTRSSCQAKFAVRVPDAIEMPKADLPIDPYLLGVWLGDGTTDAAMIAVGDEDREAMIDLVRSAWPHLRTVRERPGVSTIRLGRDYSRCLYGHEDYATVIRRRDKDGGVVGSQQRCATCNREHARASRAGEPADLGPMVNPSFVHALRAARVYGAKHIPTEYLFASAEQRLALLQGLMDTDGTVKRRGDCRISLTCERLARDLLQLVRGLGIRATWWEGDAKISSQAADGGTELRVTGRQYVITFQTEAQAFRLPRKLALTKSPSRRSEYNYIRSIRPVAPEPAKCISVDSPDHTYLAGQFVVTHNTESDHAIPVLLSGGQVASLDDLISADGVFDPLRFATTAEIGVELASSVLLSINPWGLYKDNYEVPLTVALRYGVEQGATCIGQALTIAREARSATGEPRFPEHMIDSVLDLADSAPLFRAVVGVDPHTRPLSVNEGITLIKVGRTHLDVPSPGATEAANITQRISLALIRMIVFGSAMAMAGRDGVLLIDEFWTVLTGGSTEVDRLGRVARSQRVLPIGFTQKVSDAIDAGLTGYISRGFIGPFTDREQAVAACELFELEPTEERIGRMTAKDVLGNVAEGGAPNHWSFRALRDPATGTFVRGAVFIYSDLSGRAVPVEITIPPWFIKVASTNPRDIDRRTEAFARVRTELPDATDSVVAWEVARRLSPDDDYLNPGAHSVRVPAAEPTDLEPKLDGTEDDDDTPVVLRSGPNPFSA